MLANKDEIKNDKILGDSNEVIDINAIHENKENGQILENRQVQQRRKSCCVKVTDLSYGTFLILMIFSLYAIIALFICGNIRFIFNGIFCIGLIGKLIFAFYIWAPLASKIEKTTCSTRYLLQFLINDSILSLLHISLPINPTIIWNFMVFETLLIAFVNKQKTMNFFCCKVKGKTMIALIIIYDIIFNWIMVYSIIVVIIYAIIYYKCLMQKFSIKDEKIISLEEKCIFKCLKNKYKTFITLEESQKPKENSQIINSSFMPSNIYPNQIININGLNDQNQK